MKGKQKFLQQDYHKKPSLKRKWKKPKGIQSKMRLKKRGYRKSVSVGYRTAKKDRGLHKSGLKMVNIRSLGDLKNVIKEKEGTVVSKKVGLKKKLEILKNAERGDIKVLNIDVEKFLKEAEEFLKTKKEEKKAKDKVRVKKKEEKEKVAKKKEEKTLEKEVEKSEEELKEEKRREKDKVLTKKEK